MHLKYIIKVTSEGSCYARRPNHRYRESHNSLLVETGPKLTAHFYDRMFAHNPELKEIFNMSNQRNGDQREALFNAIAAYASNIENLPALLPAVEKSRRSTPASRSNLSSTTSSAVTCWRPGRNVQPGPKYWMPGKAYGVLANVFINREAQITAKTPARMAAGKARAPSASLRNPAQRTDHQL